LAAQTNASAIPVFRLDDLHPGLEHAALLGVPDHRRADPALDRQGRVPPLDLGEDGRLQPLGQMIDPDQRRPPDALRIVFEYGHRRGSLIGPAVP
jgi:hypothetical protein